MTNNSQNDSGRIENTNEASAGSRAGPTVNRRNVLRTVALASSTGVGLGTIGTVAAATACKDDSASYTKKYDWYHSKQDAVSADNYDCQVTRPYYKVEHAASILYYGSCYWADSWKHEFHEAGHAEHFTRDYCSSSSEWEHSYGIREHSISFYNNSKSTTSLTESQNQMVKGAPPVGGYDNPNELMDYAYTGLSAAVGIYNWKLGTAMALAGVYVDNLPNDPSGGNPDTWYDWDYGYRSNAKKCGTHFVKQMVHGNGGGQGDGFNFDCYDEAWGYYPNYTQIHFNFSYNDPTCADGCTCPSSSTVSTQSNDDGGSTNACENRPPSSKAAVKPGDRIHNSKGQPVDVTEVKTVVSELAGTAPVKVRPEDLPGTLSEEVDTDDKVLFRQFPMTATKRRISGKVVQ